MYILEMNQLLWESLPETSIVRLLVPQGKLLNTNSAEEAKARTLSLTIRLPVIRGLKEIMIKKDYLNVINYASYKMCSL